MRTICALIESLEFQICNTLLHWRPYVSCRSLERLKPTFRGIAVKQQTKASQINFLLELLNDPDAEPVKDLSNRNKADPQTESADSTKA